MRNGDVNFLPAGCSEQKVRKELILETVPLKKKTDFEKTAVDTHCRTMARHNGTQNDTGKDT